MSTLVLTSEKKETLKSNNFQMKCDEFSKQCAVLLGFIIPISTAVTPIVLFFLMTAWFLAGKLEEKAKIIWTHPISRIFLLLFGVFIVGALYSEAPYEDKMEALGKMGKLLYLPFLLPLMVEEKWRRAAMAAFVSALLFTLVLSLLKVYADFIVVPGSTRFTKACIFKDHIYTNLMMAFASFVVGHYLLQPSRFLIRMALFCLWMSFIFYVFFMSQGRSGYIIFTVLWSLFCLQRLSLRGLGAGFIVLILLLGLACLSSKPFQVGVFWAVKDLDQYQVGETNTSLGARFEYVNETWQLIKKRPWFGFGTGSFKAVYETHAVTRDLQVTRNPHNEYVNILFQVGMIGLAVFLSLFALIFKKSFSLPTPERWFAQGILAAMMVGCLANSWLMDFTSGYFFIAITAFCFGALNIKKDLLRE